MVDLEDAVAVPLLRERLDRDIRCDLKYDPRGPVKIWDINKVANQLLSYLEV